ncbi:hypothetical protein [Bradyrhizobium sp. CCBAU 11386]|nr:hypothetical protein [Bradyrhizobium sp. CCBAU 11386]
MGVPPPWMYGAIPLTEQPRITDDVFFAGHLMVAKLCTTGVKISMRKGA